MSETKITEERKDARGQFARSQAKPNPAGLTSANPTVLAKGKDATFKGDPHRDKAEPEDEGLKLGELTRQPTMRRAKASITNAT